MENANNEAAVEQLQNDSAETFPAATVAPKADAAEIFPVAALDHLLDHYADAPKSHNLKSIVMLVIVIATVCLVSYLVPLLYRIYRFQQPVIQIGIEVLMYVTLAAIPIIVCRIEKTSIWKLGFSKHNIPGQVFIGIGISAITISISLLLLYFNVTIIQEISVPYMIFNIFFGFFVGFSEELVFKGYIQGHLKELTHSGIIAFIVAAIIFGLWHFFDSNWIQVLISMGFGLIWGFFKYKFEHCTLFSIIVAHGVHSSIIAALSLYF